MAPTDPVIQANNILRMRILKIQVILPYLLSRNFRGFFFRICIENGGDSWWIFSGLRFPQKKTRKLLQKSGKYWIRIGGKIRDENSKNSGIFRCNFADQNVCEILLRKCLSSRRKNSRGVQFLKLCNVWILFQLPRIRLCLTSGLLTGGFRNWLTRDVGTSGSARHPNVAT